MCRHLLFLNILTKQLTHPAQHLFAFFYAINVEKLIENIMAGHAKPIKSFLPEHYPNFHEASTVLSLT